MKAALPLLASIVLLCGCAPWGRPVIKGAGLTVTGLKDAGSPATVNTTQAGERLALPKGSRIWLKQKEAVPARPATENAPESPEQPAETVTVIEPGDATFWEKTVSTVKADTGTVDTSVAKHRIDTESRRPLLYCAIAAVVAGLGFMYVRFQAIAVMCFIGAGAFFLAWRMSEISPWVGGLFLVAAVAGFAFYKRAEWDADGDGVPDFLQKKRKPKDSV
jgi:hypothetical protein